MNVNKNKKLNQKLRALYRDAANKLLEEYEKAFGDKVSGINTSAHDFSGRNRRTGYYEK